MKKLLLLPWLLAGFALPALASENFGTCGPISNVKYFKMVKTNSNNWKIRMNTDGSNSYPTVWKKYTNIDDAWDDMDMICKSNDWLK